MESYLAITGNREKLEAHTEGFAFPDPYVAARDPAWPPFLFLFADASGAARHALPASAAAVATAPDMREARMSMPMR